MDKTFKLIRDTYRNGSTLGKLYHPGGGHLCETLEDIVRGWGIKDGGTTAIPVGRYRLTVSRSSKFKRDMVMVYTEPNKYEVKMNGIGFKGIRMHGGNSNKDTWGCIIVANNRTGPETVHGSAESSITSSVQKLEKDGHTVWLEVINKHQAQ